MIAPEDHSLADLLRLEYLPRKIGISDGGRYNLHHTVEQFSEWRGRPARLSDLNDSDISRFLAAMAATHAPATVNGARARLLAVWRFAWGVELIGTLPRSVAKAKERQPVPEAWTVAEVSRLIAHCAGMNGCVGCYPERRWWPAFLLTLYWTASRPTAILHASPADLESDGGWLRLRYVKTGRMELCPLPPAVVALVDSIRDHGAERLFVWPMSRRHLWVRFRHIVEATGLPSPRQQGRNLFYRLRRTAVSYAWKTSPDAARRLAGHTTTAMTERHYVDPRIASQREILGILPVIEIPDLGGDRQQRLF